MSRCIPKKEFAAREAIHVSLISEPSSGQGQRPVDHNVLAERCGDDVVAAREGFEGELRYQLTKRLKQQLLSHEGNPAADNDASRAQKRNNVVDCGRERVDAVIENLTSKFVSPFSSPSDV